MAYHATQNIFLQGLQELVPRWTKCVEKQGNCVKKLRTRELCIVLLGLAAKLTIFFVYLSTRQKVIYAFCIVIIYYRLNKELHGARFFCEADSGSDTCNMPPFSLWDQSVHYCVHTSLLLFYILSQMNPVRLLTPCLFKIHFNITLFSTPMSMKCLHVSKFGAF
jgi:hypothetical protein